MILVTGGTGLVGSHLLYFLSKEMEKVRAIHRRTSKLENVKKVFQYYDEDYKKLFDKIEWFEADVNEIPALKIAFQGITQVYHTAAFISFNPEHFQKLKKVNIEGTANIVNLCIAHNISKLCHVSSVATLGSPIEGELISENTEWNPEDDNSVYGITKYGAEMEVWRGSQEGLNVVMVNPGIIFGAFPKISGSGNIIKLVDNKFPFYTSGGLGVVGVEDVVTAMMLLMKSEITNERFVLISKNISYRELLKEIAIMVRKKPPKKYIEKWKLMVFASIDWFSHKIFGSKRHLLKAMVKSMYSISNYDTSKIEMALNFHFEPFEKTLEKTITYYKKINLDKKKNPSC